MSGPDDQDRKSTASKPEYRPMMPEELAAATARNEAQWRVAQAARQAGAQVDAVAAGELRQGLGIKSPEEQCEEVLEKALQEGGVVLRVSVPKHVSPEGNAGFTDMKSKVVEGGEEIEARLMMDGQLQDPGTHRRADAVESINKRGLTEIIDIRRNVRRVYENVVVPGKKGLLGIGATPDRVERRATARFEQPRHNDIVNSGRNEPAVTFSYRASSQRIGGDLYERMQWRDYSNRPGQLLICEVTLPESIAKEVEAQIDIDPGFMRRLVERFAKEKLLKDPNAWETKQGDASLGDARDALRPPYERWDRETGGRIYVQKEGGLPGWHDENVRPVKK